MSTDSQETAACCAQFYEQDWVQTILGDSFHPGGVDLTGRLIDSLQIDSDESVLDVACGIGTTSLMVGQRHNASVTGIDFSEVNVQRANEAASASAPNTTVKFKTGDATDLPVDDAAVDHLICECAVSTFADQTAAIKEFYRVLKPGGQVAISDMVLNGQLPEKLQTLLAPWTCLASAKSAAGYQQLFLDHGFVVTSYDDESKALLDMVFDFKKKLLVAGLGKTLATADGVPDVLAALDISELKTLLDEAKELVSDGVVQYCRFTFAKDRPKARKAVKNSESASQLNTINAPSSAAEDCGPGCNC
ncbi:class I SAM-dependent methyltransferase [Mariniblastus sp.]|nr:class I SAM-dependent methyltransferase [Mariniblastus sp.]